NDQIERALREGALGLVIAGTRRRTARLFQRKSGGIVGRYAAEVLHQQAREATRAATVIEHALLTAGSEPRQTIELVPSEILGGLPAGPHAGSVGLRIALGVAVELVDLGGALEGHS